MALPTTSYSDETPGDAYFWDEFLPGQYLILFTEDEEYLETEDEELVVIDDGENPATVWTDE